MRMVSTLLALELERSRAPEWASDEAAGEFVGARARRAGSPTAATSSPARRSSAAEVEAGAGVIFARAAPRAAQTGRLAGAGADRGAARAARRPARARSRGSASSGERAEVSAIVPAERGGAARAGDGRRWRASWRASLPGFHLTVARSRWVADPVDLYRAGQEALLAANVAEADGLELLAFEDTGSYRLLLPAMSEDPGELRALLRRRRWRRSRPTTSSTRPTW